MLLFILIIVAVNLAIFFFKKPFWGIIFIIGFLPFHALIVTVVQHFFKVSPIFSNSWKEFFLLILILSISYSVIKSRKFPFKILLIDKLIIVFFILGFISAIFFTKNLNQAIWGLRYDFEFFLFYFILRSLKLSKNQIILLVSTIFITAILVAVFGIVQIYFLPRDFLVKLGYSATPQGIDKPLAAYHYIDPVLPRSFRIISTLSGPNQLGSYLIMIILIFAGFVVTAKKLSDKLKLIGNEILFVIPLIYSFSRSAWLGLMGGISGLFFFKTKRKLLFILILLITFVASYFFIVHLASDSRTLQALIYHGTKVKGELRGSTISHFEEYLRSIKSVKNYPLGKGIGRVGPASLRNTPGIISENWYLQLALEMSILGAIIFLTIIISFFVSAWKIYKKLKDEYLKGMTLGIMAALLGISIAALFLHTWTDTTTAYIFWTLAGVIISFMENPQIIKEGVK